MFDRRGILPALALLALVTASRLTYLALYALALILALCDWGGRRAFRGLRVERRLSCAKAFIGQEVAVDISVRNESRFPLGWVSLRAAKLANFEQPDPVARAGIVAGRGELRLSYRLIGTSRGYYRLGPIEVSGGDPLGCRRQTASVADGGAGLTIYPPVSPLGRVPLPNVRPFGSQRDKLRAHEDPTRLRGVRDYLPGDSLRHIHWKATAARGRFQVKEFTPTVTAESLILLNLAEGEFPAGGWTACGELGVETAASLAAYLLERETVVGLATNGADPESPGRSPLILPGAAGAGQAEAILTLLARVAVAAGPEFAWLVSVQGRAAAWGACLYLITPGWTEDLTRTVQALRRLGKIPVPILLDRADLDRATAAGTGVLLARRDRDGRRVRLGAP